MQEESFLPTLEYTGVTNPKHKLESLGVSTGTDNINLLTPIVLA